MAPTTTTMKARANPVPHPYPGQQWKHGWKPLTPAAKKEKNHGRPVKPGTKLAKTSDPKGSSGDSSPTDSRTTSQRMDDAIRARSGRNNGSTRNSGGPSAASLATSTTRNNGSTRQATRRRNETNENRYATPLRKEALERENNNPFGKHTIARDPDNIKIGQTVWAGNKWLKAKNAQDAKNMSRLAKRHLDDLHSRHS
ncbi:MULTISPECIES: hypothetical protein [Streptosporangiaceae]|uniref:hypothetical protein n=1 Tax=Streptosporangiaceae TaxID=2004 RepID=UPI0033C5490C